MPGKLRPTLEAMRTRESQIGRRQERTSTDNLRRAKSSTSLAQRSVCANAWSVFFASCQFCERANPRLGPVTDGVFIARLAGFEQFFCELLVSFEIRTRRKRKCVLRMGTYESPFIACLESARIRLKEGS